MALGWVAASDDGEGIDYLLAGQPQLLVRTTAGAVRELPLPPHRLPLGALLDGRYVASRAAVAPGDLVLGYSDGVTEAQAPDGELFGEERLVRVLARGPGRSARDHRAGPQGDRGVHPRRRSLRRHHSRRHRAGRRRPSMRRRTLIILLVAAAVAAAALSLPWLLEKRAGEWTTKSPEALAAFEAGLDARMRFYLLDAAASFRKALELDPQFAAAKVQLAAVTVDGEERKRLRQELETVDVSRLNGRERFLVELARVPRETAARDLRPLPREAIPRTPGRCTSPPARPGIARTGPLRPSSTDASSRSIRTGSLARNNLGYLAMARAQFAEAEEQFRTYAYVAPDQANPHDSLGELLSLVGRYDEARTELERSLSIRPDFCASYQHLAGIAVFEGRPEEIPPLAERLGEHCPAEMQAALDCEARFFAAFISRDFDAPVARRLRHLWRQDGRCRDPDPSPGAARRETGRGRPAEEAALAKAVEESSKASYPKGKGAGRPGRSAAQPGRAQARRRRPQGGRGSVPRRRRPCLVSGASTRGA